MGSNGASGPIVKKHNATDRQGRAPKVLLADARASRISNNMVCKFYIL
jgi:hypothetical protein